MTEPRLGLFGGFGVELEYALVDRESLEVRPLADRLLYDGDRIVNEVDRGELCWSNELVAHVIELKSNGPARTLEALPAAFVRDVRRIEQLLDAEGAMPMPSAMHPLMNPQRETRLWGHGQHEIYETFDRLFDCRGHGWCNLQSMHLNLPFDGDTEFGRLHAAIRVVLPLIPALAASSPFVEGRATGQSDNRLEYYRTNSAKIPSITGRVIPEALFDEASYRREILDRIARDISPFDPDGILEADWVNARGAIARFDRGSIEIRIIDTQECPSADLAVAALTVGAVRALTEERWSSQDAQRSWSDERLESLLLHTIAEGSSAAIQSSEYLELFGISARTQSPVLDVWRAIADSLDRANLLDAQAWYRPLGVLLGRGTLAQRLLSAAGDSPSADSLVETYRELCACLTEDRMFLP